MDALYPRLLVRDFPAAVDFYRPALAELYDVQPVKVIPEAQYANWDLDGQTGPGAVRPDDDREHDRHRHLTG